MAKKRDTHRKETTAKHTHRHQPQLLVADARMLEEWYSAAFLTRIGELREQLSAEIAESLLSKFDSKLHCHNQSDNVSYQWVSGAESLKEEIAALRQRFQIDNAQEEIARTERAIAEMDSELERSFTDDSVPLSRLLQLRTAQTDLKSYLRGLKFYSARNA